MSIHDPPTAEALLFDLGNVVIEIDFHRALAIWAAFSNCDPKDLGERFSFDMPYEQHERGEIDASRYFDSLRRSLGIDLNDEQFLRGWNSIYVRAVPGINSLLKRAKEQVPLYALTNTNAAHQAQWSAQFRDLLDHFSCIFLSFLLGTRKPEPQAYLTVAEEIAVAPDKILFFDDSLENVAGARQVGMKAVHVTSFSDIETALADILG